eukprot:10388889-Alexandrium_andersonii.AAC.1
MCIRDRRIAYCELNSRSPTRCALIPGDGRGPWHVPASWAIACLNSLRLAPWSVSYTHLTLPTICSV